MGYEFLKLPQEFRRIQSNIKFSTTITKIKLNAASNEGFR